MSAPGRARLGSIGLGALVAISLRALLGRALLWRFRTQLRALNAGDPGPVLASYAEDAVLRFNDGEHRWSGEYRGRAAIGRFLRNFVAAGLVGELEEVFFAGPPWRMSLAAHMRDEARDADGHELYRNRVVLLFRTRWGQIALQEDFYEDTVRMAAFERRLRERGIEPVA